MANASKNLAFILRQLATRPVFTTLTVLTLALGIAANAAIFSIVNSVLLRPLPYDSPGRIVQLWQKFSLQDPDSRFEFSEVEFVDYREQNEAFQELAGYYVEPRNLLFGDEPEQILIARVTPGLFDVLGVEAERGRTFAAQEGEPGRDKVAILSHATARERFGQSDAALGQSLRLDGQPYQVIGVTPEGFHFPGKREPWGHVSLWIPEAIDLANLPAQRWGSFGRYLQVVARLKPGATLEGAETDLERLTTQFERQYPEAYQPQKGYGVEVLPLIEAEVGDVRPALLALLGAGALVLLITCFNVGSLLLTRSHRRRKEFAVRTALGASRVKLIRQLLGESLVLAFIGGALGLLLAYWGLQLLIGYLPSEVPRIDQVSLDPIVVVFTGLITLLAGILVGSTPAFFLQRIDPAVDLKEGAGWGGSAGVGGQRFRHVLVIAEVAVALVVLVGAGLLVKNFMQLRQIDPGFDAEGLLTARIELPRAKYDDQAEIRNFYVELMELVEAVPGVRNAGLVSHLPLGGTNSSWGISVENRPTPPGEPLHEVDFRVISPGYFEAMEIPLLEGRSIAETDVDSPPWVVVVDRRLAQRYWPGESPIGKRIKQGDLSGESPWTTVVGVVEHVKHQGVGVDLERDQVYYALRQIPWRSMTLVVESETDDPLSLVGDLRRAVREIDHEQPLAAVQTMEDWYGDSLARPRFSMILLGVFGTIALVLVLSGTYGVLSALTSERVREIGVRMALGAGRRRVVRSILRQSLVLGGIGVTVGVVAAFLSTQALTTQLYEISATDPWVFVLVPLLLLVVVLAATLIPAGRAATTEPVIALRQE